MGGTAAGIGVFMQNFMGAGVSLIAECWRTARPFCWSEPQLVAALGLLSALLAGCPDRDARRRQRAARQLTGAG
jgi:hypothetical protein